MCKLFQTFILKKLAKIDQNRKPQSTKISENKYIGVFFDLSDINDPKFIDKFVEELKQNKNNVEILGFYTKYSFKSEIKELYLDKKFLSKPQTQEFLNKEFDVLLFYSRKENCYIHKLLCFSKAKFKISPFFKKANFADFLYIINSKIDGYKEFAELTKRYIFEA